MFFIFFLFLFERKHILNTFSLYNKGQIVEEHINYLPPHKVDASKGPPLRCTTLYSHSFNSYKNRQTRRPQRPAGFSVVPSRRGTSGQESPRLCRADFVAFTDGF